MKRGAKSEDWLLKAELIEIMESIQGEGLLLGVKQVFLRFAGCNLRCSYCDTASSRQLSRQCLVFGKTGSREILEEISNPLSIIQVSDLLQHFSSSWVSLTGGEPLLQVDFIAGLMTVLKPRGYKFLLETNGTLPQALEKCLPWLDMISMDYKLSSAMGSDCAELHQQFLYKAREKPCYVKIVITAETHYGEITDAVSLIKNIDRKIPLILQPVTPNSKCQAPEMDFLLELQKGCLEKLEDVRIVPQIHPFMGLI